MDEVVDAAAVVGSAMLEESENEASQRRSVFDAIVALSEADVDEQTLLHHSQFLDRDSWIELIEERYLGRLCGFPLCNNTVEIKRSQKYRIDAKHRKVYERSALRDKFCGKICLNRSSGIAKQLDDEPLWIRGSHNKKKVSLDGSFVERCKNPAKDFEFIKESFVGTLSSLNIDDCLDSEDDKYIESEGELAEDRFNECFKFITNKISDKSMKKTVNDQPVEKSGNREVLNRIRQKYSQVKTKKSPLFVEAQPTKTGSTKHMEAMVADLRRLFCEWFGKETKIFLQDFGIEEESVSYTMTEARRMVAQFYAGERNIDKEKELDVVMLPAVDRIDQRKQRLFILISSLMPSWRRFEAKLQLHGYGCHLQNFLSTFNLSSANVFITKNEANVIVAVLFRLLAAGNRGINEAIFSSDQCFTKKFEEYLNSVACDIRSFNEICDVCREKLIFSNRSLFDAFSALNNHQLRRL